MTDYATLRSLIVRVRRRWAAHVILRTIAMATAAAAVPLLAAIVVDRRLAPTGVALLLLGSASLLAATAAALLIVWRMQRRPDDRHVARFIEERAGQQPGVEPLDDTLVSAVELGASPHTPGTSAFLPLVAAAAIRRLEGVDVARLVPTAAIRRAAAQAGGGVVVLTIALVLAAPTVIRAFETGRARFFPETIQVDVLPGDVRVPIGTPLRIRATVRGASRTLTGLTPSLHVLADGESRSVSMTRVDDSFEFAFESIDRSFKYSIAAGSARSSDYTVTALVAPHVRRIDVRYAYPSFTGMAPRDEEDGGDIYAPAGTRVRLRIHTDRPAASGELTMDPQSAVALRPSGERTLDAEMVLKTDGSYRVKLRDADGLASDGDTEYFIRLMEDRPPDVRILRPSADQQITPLEEVAIEARADDDHGISLLELVYSVGGGPERRVPFDRVTGTDIQKIGSRLLAAEDLGVKPGDVITYYARARDVGRGKRPTETRSDLFFLEVKPFNEEFVAAQSQAGGSGGGDAQLESLIAAQKEIISATWNIERRAQGGRSADDVQAIAQAQAALKARVEQMSSSRQRGPDRPPAPERPAPLREAQPRASPGDPIAQAIEAMTRALQQLEGQKTKEAIPHEMAALNGLLQAQAEVRRRQVSQQSASSGSGGSNRSGQDLSALFDKELQRQQKTNYENRSQIEERPDRREASHDTLDRIRDLAKRQEDLSRRERELANAGLSAEEIKRRLEKLTREQNELRQEAEDLARKSGPPSAAGGMREATEQMKNAAGDLRRENANGAAESGERAAEQLRRLEQQMRGGSAGAQERAQGELQLEAQQVAQEQRRIASEAERLEKAQGSSASDAKQRLADEKERLADRVDELQRRAQQLSTGKGAGKGKQGAAAGEAARSLQRERVGDRMRESAKEMRGGKPNAEGERQLARALDKVNEQLGGGDQSAGSRELSDQLERTRAIRERLNRLEQQMREAEGREQAPGRAPRDSASESRGGRQSGQGAQEKPGARTSQPSGREARGGREGQGSGARGQSSDELQRLRQEYQRELQRAREALGTLQAGQPRDGSGNTTPEEHEFSRSAPGTEAFKQDRSGWESLRKDVDQALERYETGLSRRLGGKDAPGRLSAGGSERVPDRYRDPIAKYFESLAKVKK